MNKCEDNDKLLVASHNKESIEIIKKINLKYCLENIEFAQLMGMSDELSKSWNTIIIHINIFLMAI